MKKIIVGILGLALLITGQNVSASTTWNGASNDCKGISIANATTNEGYAYPCWPSSSVSADAGDTLNVRIYYHNTGSDTANNTRVVLSAPLGSSGTSKSFSGSISSDQGGLSLGSVTANLSSSQTITFNNVKWYTNNTSETPTALLGGQNGSEILSGGLNIGSIASGWATQGSLVVSFHVSNTTTQLCQDSSANNYNSPLPCTYPTQLCKDTSASNYNGALPCTYPQLCQDPSANNYHGALPCTYPPQLCKDTSASNYNGALPCTYPQLCRDTSASNYLGALPCTYPQPVCTISNFNANPTSITSGDSATLNWSTSDCTNVTISNLSYSVPTSGSQSVWPTQTTTYTLTARNSTGATQNRTVTVAVNQPSVCSINNFSASPTSITSGDSATLNWSTSDCTNVTISNLSYSVPTSGSQSVWPTQTTTYTLTARNSTGATQTLTSTVYVNNNNNNNNNSNCSIDSFTASNTYINSG